MYIEAEKRQQILSNRLTELAKRWSGKNAVLTGQRVDRSQLAERLLFRAPLEFLETRTATDIEAVIDRAVGLLREALETPGSVHIESKPAPRGASFVVALTDRPFIVKSILDCAHELGMAIATLLHPVLELGERRVSLTYFEVIGYPEGDLERLRASIEAALTALVPVTDDHAAMLEAAREAAESLPDSRSGDAEESRQFLNWLSDGAFIFLGAARWEREASAEFTAVPGSELGLLRFEPAAGDLARELTADLDGRSDPRLVITRLRSASPVIRKVRINHVVVPNSRGAWSFLGIFSSRAFAEECSRIPIIRRRFREIVELEGAREGSHNYKGIGHVIDSLPKDEAVSVETETLREIVRSALDVAATNEPSVHLRVDERSGHLSLLVMMPRGRYGPDVRRAIGGYLSDEFGVSRDAVEFHLGLSNRPLVSLYFDLPLPSAGLMPGAVERIKRDLLACSRTWEENLAAGLIAHGAAGNGSGIRNRYRGAFPEDYRAAHSTEEALADIEVIEALTTERPVLVRFRELRSSAHEILVYSGAGEIPLSRALPILEKAGFETVSERTTRIEPLGGESVYLHRFSVRTRRPVEISGAAFDRLVAPELSSLLAFGGDTDVLTSLMLYGGLTPRAVRVIRTYCRLLWHMTSFATRQSIVKSFANHPEFAVRIWKMFELLFDPSSSLTTEERRAAFAEESKLFADALREVGDLSTDRILRATRVLVDSTVRTNCFLETGALALKIHSERVDFLSRPRPLFEIFVSSPTVEGVHLRSGMVARGGLRWSDLVDDYRTEILGLVKTQRIKNVIIVPTGAKGGFIVRGSGDGETVTREHVQSAYREYIRALLSVTDNRSGGAVVSPENVICYDGPDPYLVVAADKGTATFSDVANEISEREFGFWLGDAFASGGSNGYDHKRYAITAKGAWMSVERHFRDIGLDHLGQPFTAVGIGDMSGDVFGNGMLLSNRMKLIAAFNHKHIFVDPDPDPERSFAERQRLFSLPGSQWTDYNRSFMSAGGGVYGRFDKEIRLSPEARRALGVPDDVPAAVNGEELISIVLKAPCDLLWNGGIGTYVKASSEAHSAIGDGTNDSVRVDASELRARVVGEGGNLGFTQRARNEFAIRGGRINTDAVDNSGGVDLSDHEVNIKILLGRVIERGALTREERNDVLREIAPEVVESVLEHNRSHALLVTLGVKRSIRNINYFRALLRELERCGYVGRTRDCLPNDDEIDRRAREGLGLLRPEVAVCIAGMKMWTRETLARVELEEEPVRSYFLLDYFPPNLQRRYRDDILEHPLAKEIIVCAAANTLVDTLGITALHRLAERYGVDPVLVVQAALAAELLIGGRGLARELGALDTLQHTKSYQQLVQSLSMALIEVTGWLISRHRGRLSVRELLDLYRKGFEQVLAQVEPGASSPLAERFRDRFARFEELGLPPRVVRHLVVFPDVLHLLEVTWVANSSGKPLADVAEVLGIVVSELSVDLLLALIRSVETRDRWENELIVSAGDSVRESLSRITSVLLESRTNPSEVRDRIRGSLSFERWAHGIEELRQRAPGVSMLAVMARQLEEFAIS